MAGQGNAGGEPRGARVSAPTHARTTKRIRPRVSRHSRSELRRPSAANDTATSLIRSGSVSFEPLDEPETPLPSRVVPKAGMAGWSRELWAGIVQLVVVALVLAGAAVWNAQRSESSNPGQPSAPLPSASSAIKSDEEGTWLEGGAFRTLSAISRRLDLSPKKKKTGRRGKRGQVQDFRDRLDEFELPVPSPRWVKKATQRRQGNFVLRDLRFSSSKGISSLVEEYQDHFRSQGYKVRRSQVGRVAGAGAELIGSRGRDKITVKLRPGSEGKSVQVTMNERFESLERR